MGNRNWCPSFFYLVGIFLTSIVIKHSLKNREVIKNSEQGTASPQPQISSSGQTEVLLTESMGAGTADSQALARLGDQYFESSNFNQAEEAASILQKTVEMASDNEIGQEALKMFSQL